MDVNKGIVEPLTEFIADSQRLIAKCTKPDRKGKMVVILLNTCRNLDFMRVARATGIGFLAMGFLGFLVKLIHIPINNILVGGA